MPYSKIVQPGDVVFYKPDDLIGWVISKVTKSPYSHVALVIDTNTVIEADIFIKCRLSTLSYNKEVHHVYRLKNTSAEDQMNIVNQALPMIGVSYDYWQIIGLFFRLMFKFEHSTLNNLNKFICSEVIDRVFVASNIPRRDRDMMFDITPHELLNKYDLERIL